MYFKIELRLWTKDTQMAKSYHLYNIKEYSKTKGNEEKLKEICLITLQHLRNTLETVGSFYICVHVNTM